MLQEHTEYGTTSDDYKKDSPLIKMFWEVLESLSEDEQRKFIQFCWAQDRLPINDSNFRLKVLPYDADKDQDKQLPEASTCFFNFKLPKYSSYDIMRKKIIQAINLDCISMNAE